MFVPKTENSPRILPTSSKVAARSSVKSDEHDFREAIESILSADAVEVTKDKKDLTEKEKDKRKPPSKEEKQAANHLNITV